MNGVRMRAVYAVRLLDLVRGGHNRVVSTVERWNVQGNDEVRRLVEVNSCQAER